MKKQNYRSNYISFVINEETEIRNTNKWHEKFTKRYGSEKALGANISTLFHKALSSIKTDGRKVTQQQQNKKA